MIDGLYNLCVEPPEGGKLVNAGIVVLREGTLLGGDAFFYYVGRYTVSDGVWRGGLATRQHTPNRDARPAFGGIEVKVELSGRCVADVLEEVATAVVDGAGTPRNATLRRIADA